jgi:AcrR family transcriptional regulator
MQAAERRRAVAAAMSAGWHRLNHGKAAAGRQLGELGYARMSLESVASTAGTTVPSLRRRYRNKAELVAAVICSLRVEDPPVGAPTPRAHALAILENFHSNLRAIPALAILGSLLACELTARRAVAGRSGRRAGVSRPVGRVLCTRLRGPTVIHLGLPLPAASCGLPASIGRAALKRSRRSASEPADPLDLAPGGVYQAAAVTCGAGGLLHHRFTLTPAPNRHRGGLFSVALSRGSPRVGVTDHPAL